MMTSTQPSRIKSVACTKIKLKKYKDKDVQVSGQDFQPRCLSGTKWVLAHYRSKISAIPKAEATDLATFPEKMRVDAIWKATIPYWTLTRSPDLFKRHACPEFVHG